MNCKFEVIQTGSDGNCYLLTFENEVLIIECGINFTKIKKALDFDLSKVAGVLISHEHGDHSHSFKDVLKFGKKIFCTPGTASALKISRFQKVKYLQPAQIGLFKVTPFQVFHDAKEPCGFLIEFGSKRMAFITDTCDLKTRLKNINYWIIEANYSTEVLQKSKIDPSLKSRVERSHMSIDRCKVILEAHNAKESELVLLIHLSEKNACKEEFLNKIPYAAIAENGLIIEL